ncbi:hypothetical protein DIPPA_20020 [Diplonema papillatum]|nr:hypothetical protein DIPPA_20020 [Diplonema papillatum]
MGGPFGYEYSVRPLQQSDEAIIAQWIKENEGVSRRAVLGRTVFTQGWQVRLDTYKDRRAVVVDKRTLHGTMQVACCAWGLKRVFLKGERVTLAYLMDAYINPNCQQELSVALKSTRQQGWGGMLDGEYASCCSTGDLGAINMQTLRENGFFALGSCRFYCWTDRMQQSWADDAAMVADVEVVRLGPENKEITSFWKDVFQQHALRPANLEELMKCRNYTGSVVVKTRATKDDNDRNWACVTRWNRNAEAPMIVDNKAGHTTCLSYEILCCIAGSSDVQVVLEAMRIAASDAVRDGAELIYAIVDEACDPAIRVCLEKMEASCVRYINGVRLYNRDRIDIVPNPTNPTFWDPRDIGVVWAVVEDSTKMVPQRLLDNMHFISQDVVNYMLRTTHTNTRRLTAHRLAEAQQIQAERASLAEAEQERDGLVEHSSGAYRKSSVDEDSADRVVAETVPASTSGDSRSGDVQACTAIVLVFTLSCIFGLAHMLNEAQRGLAIVPYASTKVCEGFAWVSIKVITALCCPALAQSVGLTSVSLIMFCLAATLALAVDTDIYTPGLSHLVDLASVIYLLFILQRTNGLSLRSGIKESPAACQQVIASAVRTAISVMSTTLWCRLFSTLSIHLTASILGILLPATVPPAGSSPTCPDTS